MPTHGISQFATGKISLGTTLRANHYLLKLLAFAYYVLCGAMFCAACSCKRSRVETVVIFQHVWLHGVQKHRRVLVEVGIRCPKV